VGTSQQEAGVLSIRFESTDKQYRLSWWMELYLFVALYLYPECLQKKRHQQDLLFTKEFLSMLLINFMLNGAFYLVASIIPVYVEHLGAGDNTSLVVGIFILPALVIRPIAGLLCDWCGYKRIGLVAIGLMVVAYWGYWQVSELLLLFRFIHGVAYGMVISSVNGYCNRIIPDKRSSEGYGYWSATSYLGMMASSVSLYLADGGHFSIIFGIGIAFIFASFLLLRGLKSAGKISERPRQEKEVEDQHLSIWQVTKIMMPYGAIMMGISIYPIAVTTYIQQYAVEMGYRGHDATFMLVNTLIVLVSRLIIGKQADNYGRGRFVVFGFASFTVSMLLFSFGEGLGFFYSVAVLNGLAISCFGSWIQSLANNLIPESRRGLACSIYYTIYELGSFFAYFVGGSVGEHLGYQHMWLYLFPGKILSAFLAYKYMRRSTVTA
jgi:MFS family permease